VPPAWLATGADYRREGDKYSQPPAGPGFPGLLANYNDADGRYRQHEAAMATAIRVICRPKLPTGG